MLDVLIVSDAAWVRDDVRSVLDTDDTVRELTSGAQVLAAIGERAPDIAVVDLQVGTMGGIAICMELHLEEGMERLPRVPVLLLLDRRADVFLARRAAADGWVIKPLDPMRLRRAIAALVGGGTYHDETYKPYTIPAP